MARVPRTLDRWLGGPRDGVADVDYWRSRVVDVAMIMGIVLGSLSVIPGVFRAWQEQNYPLLVADLAALMLAIPVLLLRRLPYSFRGGALIFLAMGVGLVQVWTSGLHTVGPLWLFSGPILAAILFDLRVALGLIGLLAVFMFGQLGLARAGLLPQPLAGQVGTPIWVETATDLILLSTVVSFFLGVLLRGLQSSIDQQRRLSEDVESERLRLLGANAELEQQVEWRKAAEAERARLALAIEQAEEAMVILELDARVNYVNAAFRRLFGRDEGSVIGERLPDLDLFGDPADAERVLRKPREGGVWAGRLECCRGGERWHSQASFSPLRDGDGIPTHHLGVIRDISRESELEEQLRHSQKMQAMGTFAGGIAHDFNNMLVPIIGTAEILKEDIDGRWREQIDDILRSAHRGKDLVGQILAFSRGADTPRGPLRLASALEESDRLLRASIPATIELVYEVEDAGPVLLSAAEAQQVLMNLCTNAFHAMRDRPGRLTISVERVAGSEIDPLDGIRTGEPDPDRSYACLRVVDTGEGMTEDTLARAFEPFFTTKEAAEGTGLGLSMVHGVVQRAGGVIRARSTPGVGTTVEVLLPRLETDEPVAFPEESSFDEGLGQRILVVDDEGSVLRLAGRLLEKVGYDPLLAGDPDEALEAVRRDRTIALLITDLSMPQMDGIELGRAAREIRPGLPLVLSSGLLDGETRLRADEAGFVELLPKPFGKKEFARAVSAALRNRQPG